jgi:hypothetical protein
LVGLPSFASSAIAAAAAAAMIEAATDAISRGVPSLKSNIFVNSSKETKYFYQDVDAEGKRLHGSKNYTVTFAPGQTPPARGFWSLTLYNRHHFFAPNAPKSEVTNGAWTPPPVKSGR